MRTALAEAAQSTDKYETGPVQGRSNETRRHGPGSDQEKDNMGKDETKAKKRKKAKKNKMKNDDMKNDSMKQN
jgi:hypothetical protein